jgi:hypothetical protein
MHASLDVAACLCRPRRHHYAVWALNVMPFITLITLTNTLITPTCATVSCCFHDVPAGQDGIAMAVWALNVVLFIAFSCLLASRALFFPRTLASLWRHPNQSLFVGAIPMAFNTITNGVVVFLIPR